MLSKGGKKVILFLKEKILKERNTKRTASHPPTDSVLTECPSFGG